MNTTTKRMVIMLASVGVILGLIFGFGVFKGVMIKKFFASRGAPPQSVSTMVARLDNWQSSISAVGSLKAVRGADMSLEVPGIVDEILFKEGEEVKAGTIIARLRSGEEQARLNALDASAQLAASTYERNRKQFEAKAISQASLDVDNANLKNAQAAVAQQRAILEKKVVRAPFSGKLGVRMVGVGEYIQPGTPIVTLQALDPIYADFYLPAQQVARVNVGQKALVKIDNESPTGVTGSVTAINPKVDASSRNVLVRTTLPNPTEKLLPGSSVNISIDTGAPQRYITLPQTAITYNPYGDTVFIAQEDGKDDQGKPKYKARQTFIVTGPTRGDQVAVLEGVKEGDTVITAGGTKLQNDTPLLVNNAVQPSNNPAPMPIDR